MKVSVKDSLLFGIQRVLQNWRLVLFVYFINLSFGLILVFPIVTLFVKDVSHSLVARRLSEGFDYRWYIEFVHMNSKFFTALFPGAVFILALYAAIDMFLAGGFFVALSNEGRTRIHEVVMHGAKNFLGMILVSFVQVLLIILLYKLNRFWSEGIIQGEISVLNENEILKENLFRYGVISILLLAIIIISEFSRVGIALDSERSLLLKAFRGLTFAFKHPLQIIGIFLTISIMSAGLTTAYFYAGFYLHAGTAKEVIAGMIVGQLVVLSRAAVKLLFYSAEVFFYINVQTEVIRVTPQILE
ncbi:MAG: hypothetical protein ACP5US_09320 [Candidatus Kryptoniota bacterium]